MYTISNEEFKCLTYFIDGHVCEIVDMGEWLCGYVGVPNGHPYYGMDYDDIDTMCDITFSGFREGSAWYFGVDTSHYYNEVNGTTLDVEALKVQLAELVSELKELA